MSADYEIKHVPINVIFSDDDFNCRGPIPTIEVTDLAQDILKNKLLSPISVQPASDVGKTIPEGKLYRIIAGHRRFRAWQVLHKSWDPGEPAQGLEPWDAAKGNPFDTIPVMVKTGLSEVQARVLNLGENLKRRDLNIMQEANAIRHLRELNVPRDHVAAELGMSSGWVQTRYYLLDLPEAIQKEAAAGLINQNQIKQLYSLRDDPAKQFEAVKKIKNAKIAGETVGHVGERKKQATDLKKERKKAEIYQMMEIFAKSPAQYGLHTRALAWCAGAISTEELFTDLRKWCDEHGLPQPKLPVEF
jgi:ParB-like chromosome segregation protein Spo0J